MGCISIRLKYNKFQMMKEINTYFTYLTHPTLHVLSVLVLKIESQHYISNMWKQGPKNDKLLLLEKPCA